MAPFPDETLPSYEVRLANANNVAVADLRAAAGHRGPLDADDLSALTRREPRALLMALPELRTAQQHQDLPSGGRWPQPPTPGHARSGQSTLIRPACHRCAAARGATGDVFVWAPSEVQVCLRHRLWIGGRDPGGQWDLCEVVRVPAAQRHHTNLVRRHGRPAVQTAFSQVIEVTARWAQQGIWSHGALARYRTLTGVTDSTPRAREPLVALIYYPEAVGLLSLFVSPFWTRVLGEQPATASDHDAVLQRFYTEVRHRAGCDVTSDSAAAAPLTRWCEQLVLRVRARRSQSGPAVNTRAAP